MEKSQEKILLPIEFGFFHGDPSFQNRFFLSIISLSQIILEKSSEKSVVFREMKEYKSASLADQRRARLQGNPSRPFHDDGWVEGIGPSGLLFRAGTDSDGQVNLASG